jgi:hypothetical protein
MQVTCVSPSLVLSLLPVSGSCCLVPATQTIEITNVCFECSKTGTKKFIFKISSSKCVFSETTELHSQGGIELEAKF